MKTLYRTQGVAPFALAFAMLIFLAGCAGAAGANTTAGPSPTASVGLIDSQEQAAEVLKNCMAAMGYSEDSGGGYSVPNEQAEKLNTDLTTCSKTVDAGTAPWDDSDWTKVFSENVATAKCLAEHGYSVPEEPSLQTFRDTYGEAGMWDPYANVADSKVQSVMSSECPQPEPVW